MNANCERKKLISASKLLESFWVSRLRILSYACSKSSCNFLFIFIIELLVLFFNLFLLSSIRDVNSSQPRLNFSIKDVVFDSSDSDVLLLILSDKTSNTVSTPFFFCSVNDLYDCLAFLLAG